MIITVFVSYEPDNGMPVQINEDSTVEDTIIGICKLLKIGPVARYLFGLKCCSTNSNLNLSHRIMESENNKMFEIGIRFNVPDVEQLKKIDINAYNFYFKQAKYLLLHDKIPHLDYDKHCSIIIGLSVIDMYRATLEDNISKEEVIRDYKKYVPERAKKRHFIFLKKPVVQKFNEINVEIADALFCKNGYLEQFKEIAPHYLSEEFKGFIDEVVNIHPVILRVDPFDLDFPGISVKYEHKEDWEHICSIENLCFINVQNGGNIEIGRTTGVPLYMKFLLMSTMKAFISFVDTYYRLMVKWSFNLCHDFPAPSLVRLLKMKCHGPVSGVFSYRKLSQKRKNQVGCFILRESDIAYNTYYMDVCVKTSPSPVTYKIEVTEDKKYKLLGEDKVYSSLQQLVYEHRNEENEPFLHECLPPSDYDDSNLLLCKNSKALHNEKMPYEEIKLTKPICIEARKLMVFKNVPMEGNNPLTAVYRSFWYDPTNTKRSVAIKILKENFQKKNLSEFLRLMSRWAFVKAGAVVKLYGFTLANPISMVMEFLPLGQLDFYLNNPENRLKIEDINLLEASTCLANALYYLEEAKFIHGNIRCRKLLVATHHDNSFVVKLGDPGLRTPYKDIDLHWIPPEYHDNPEKARSSSMADVWAFATTVWEIFSWGKLPPNGDAVCIKKFYNNPRKHLLMPSGCPRIVYLLMLDCWKYNIYSRKKQQAIMRDLNHIFYQVYNSRKVNSYATIATKKEIEQDNVSNKSKTSDDISSSLISELTLNTLLDDGDDEDKNSAGLTLSNATLSTDIMYQVSDSPEYHCITNKDEIMSVINQENHNNDLMNPIASLQSIFELDKEWNLILTGRIGEGFYGEVYKGKLLHMYENKEQEVAIKKLKADAMNKTDFDREISIMLKLEHANIVKIKGIVQDPELCLVLEYVKHGSLQCYLSIHKERLTTQHLLKYALDVAKGMAYLSEMRFIHRDLAARNILVVNEFYVKISDFGLARCINNSNYYILRTPRELPIKWYAPESIEFGKFSPQSDVWSYGVTLYEMFSFAADPQLPDVKQQPEEIQKALKNNIRLPMPAQCPHYIYANVMLPCWAYSANSRPTFDNICKTIQEIFPVQYK